MKPAIGSIVSMQGEARIEGVAGGGASTAHVYTVPAGEPFLDALARAILSGDLPRRGGTAPDLLDLPAMTLLLPTRRATRALQDAFLRVSGGRSMLLPSIRPISEGDEDASLIADVFRIDRGWRRGRGSTGDQ